METPQNPYVVGGLAQPPPDIPHGFSPPPGCIKVFGVMHLVLGGLGILCNLSSSVQAIFADKMNRMVGNMPGQPSGMEEALQNYTSDVLWLSWLYLIMGVVLTVLIFIAGLNLLKFRDKGRRVSNLYAWCSIGSKLLMVILSIVFVLPAMRRMQEAMGLGSDQLGQVSSVTNALTGVAAVLTYVVMMVYPIVVLIFMKRKDVKDYLAGR